MVKPIRMIYIGDGGADLQNIVLTLQRFHYEPDIFQVNTPDTLWQIIQENAPTLALCDDAALPLWVTKIEPILRQESLRIPLIAVVENGVQERVLPLIDEYCCDYVVKNDLLRLGYIIRREEQERERQLQLSKMQQIQRQMEKTMSHEIRPPLNGIVGMIDLTLMSELTLEQRENLTLARSSANSLLAIINDILDFSRMEAGKMMVEWIPFVLKDFMRKLLRPHEVHAQDKGLEIQLTLDPFLPHTVMGDPYRFQQVIHNLLSNAIKFTDTGTIKVAAWVKERTDWEIIVTFTVTDTGIGIPRERVDQLFRSFTQVDNTITRKYGGTGLGLAISRRIIEMMGGTIWVESELGKGSSFSFVIPFRLEIEKQGESAEPICKWLIKDKIVQQTEVLGRLFLEDDLRWAEEVAQSVKQLASILKCETVKRTAFRIVLALRRENREEAQKLFVELKQHCVELKAEMVTAEGRR